MIPAYTNEKFTHQISMFLNEQQKLCKAQPHSYKTGVIIIKCCV